MFTSTTENQETFGTEYINIVYRYSLLLSRNRVDAEDLVQETYVRAIEAFGRLREDSNVRSWLLTILRNLWFNELRKRLSRPQVVEIDAEIYLTDAFADKMPDAYDVLERAEDAMRIRTAIAQLSQEFQEIIVLREFEELSYQEIATVLQCPLGTVMSRLGRSRAKLRAILESQQGDAVGKGRKT